MYQGKEERSGRTLDWPNKIQATSLVGRFWQSADSYDTHKSIFHFMRWKFSKPYLLHNIKDSNIRCTVYSSSTLFFLVSRLCLLSITNLSGENSLKGLRWTAYHPWNKDLYEISIILHWTPLHNNTAEFLPLPQNTENKDSPLEKFAFLHKTRPV